MDYDTQKKCGFCNETIPRGASRCPYCGSILEVSVDESFADTEPERLQQPAGSEPSMPQHDAPMDSPVGGQEPVAGQGGQEPGEGQGNQEPGAGQGDQGPVADQGGQRPDSDQRFQGPAAGQGIQRPYYPRSFQPMPQNGGKAPLSNGLKVFLTVLFTVLPGIGQLAGIITAIVFMSAEGDSDRKSFGVALLVACLVMFMLSCVGCFTLAMLGQSLSYY